jgi:hypothetical protein
MAKDAARLCEKALKHGRSVFAHLEAERFAQLTAAAGRAETVLFRLICNDPADLGFCSAFGEVAGLHAYAGSAIRSRRLAFMPVALARAALWACDRADPSHGDPADVVRAVYESGEAATVFPGFDGGARDMSPEARVIAAADARFQVAHLLAKYLPGRDKQPLSADRLNHTLRSRDKFYRSDEELLYHFHTASCVALEPADEAWTLAQEAADFYRTIVEIGARSEQDAVQAEERLQAIQKLLG